MQAAPGLEDKVNALKRVEVYCYQIAYYMLKDEALAADAAMKALFALYEEGAFFEQTPEIQRRLAKRKTVCLSLQMKMTEADVRLLH